MENSTQTETVESEVETPIETPAAAESSEIVDLTETTPLEQDNELSIDDFLNAKANVHENVQEKPKEKVEEKEVEEVQAEKPVVETQNQAEPQQNKFPSRPDQLKALGITNENAINVLKKLPNAEFGNLIRTFEENKKLKEETVKFKQDLEKAKASSTSPSLYSHPQGYILNPQYNKLSAAAGQAQVVARHWALQAAKIQRGEQWQDLTVDKEGKITVDPTPKEPTTDAQLAVDEQLSEAKDYYHDFNRQVKDLKNNHETSYKKDINYTRDLEEKFFPGYDKEDHWSKEIQTGLINLLPEQYRDHPLAKTLAKTVANNAKFARDNENLSKKLASIPVRPNKSSSPAPNRLLPARTTDPKTRLDPKNMQDDDLTVEDFQKARQGLL